MEVDEVDQERTTEGQYLDYEKVLKALNLLPHPFLKFRFLRGQSAPALLLFLTESAISIKITFQSLPALLIDEFGLF